METFWVAMVGFATNDMPYATYSILIYSTFNLRFFSFGKTPFSLHLLSPRKSVADNLCLEERNKASRF